MCPDTPKENRRLALRAGTMKLDELVEWRENLEAREANDTP